MIVRTPSSMSPSDYDQAALEYFESLPLEHFTEATPQATQREITVVSLAVLKTMLSDMHYFNEPLVQYWNNGQLGQVVPDNMIVHGELPQRDRSHYSIPLEPLGPLLVLEYVSQSNPEKDYEVSFNKYERELKPSYCLIFDPANQDLRIYRHTGDVFERLEPDAQGRCAIAELDLHVGLLDHWVRFWHKEKLLPITAEAQVMNAERDRQLAKNAQQLSKKDKTIAQHEKKIARSEKQLAKQKTEVEQTTRKMNAAMESLRKTVETRARLLGREEVLRHLPEADIEQLSAWIAELTQE